MNKSANMRAALMGVALAIGSPIAWAGQLVVPAGATITLPSGALALACANLIVQGSVSLGASDVFSAGSVTIDNAATLGGGAATIGVGGDWTNLGTFTRGTSLVEFEDGCTTSPAQLTGVTAFTNLSFTSAVGRIFVIPSGNAISVFGQLMLAGAAGSPIQIVSANSSQPTSIVLGASATISSTYAQLGTNVVVTPATTGELIARYRLYSPGTFEHLYTTDFNEYSVLPACCAWAAEGAIYKLFKGVGSFGGITGVPYYRLYNPYSYQHHWTTDANEYSVLPTVGWAQEGIDGYILPTQPAGSLPLYRLYLNAAGGLHLWTTDANERAFLIANNGWIDEGIAGYVLPLQ